MKRSGKKMADTESTEGQSPCAVEAKQMFVLMKRDFRISRNVRAQWYFQHLNKPVKIRRDKEEGQTVDEDLEVLGAVPEQSPPIDSYKLTPNTLVYFLGKRYRLVFILDYSPSTAVVDAEQNCVLHDRVFLAFRNFLMGLVQPFRIPSRNELVAPQLYITVLAYTPYLKNRGRQALLQGCLVNVSNLFASIQHVEVALERFLRGVTEASTFSAQAMNDGGNDRRARSKFIVPTDSALIDMIRFGMLAVQLLPENTSAGIIVFTDCVHGLPDSSVLEMLLSQLRVWTISCSFALVRRDGGSPDYAFGKVPNTELMRFLSSATFGVHLQECPNVGPSLDSRLNIYHKAVLCWSFQRALEDYMNIENTSRPAPLTHLPCQLMKVRNLSNVLATSLQAVLAVRLREGYTVKKVIISEKQIKMELLLPWKYEVNLGYVVVSDWPSAKHCPKVKVELYTEGPYEFINDLTAPKWNRTMSAYRTLACRTYLDTVHSVIQADKMLVHFNSFRLNPVYYTLPEPVKNGVPLFHMLADSDAPVVSSVELQHQQYALFCQYWRPICTLDMNIWQKWLHTHRISLLLAHDTPLSAHLHTSSRNGGRYGTVSCRLSVTAIDNALKQWATFTLMDNHSYIKFEYDECDAKTPCFFYIIRPSFKPPCIVIRLAFLGGICGAVRHQIMADLTEKLLSLRVSQRSLSTSAPNNIRSPSKASQLVSEQFVPVKACQLLKKPIEKILVRYDRIPKDLFHMVHFDDLGRSNTSLNSVLCRYLHCKRYLWSLKRSPSVLPMNTESAAFILRTVVTRRLIDGFRFAYSCDGFLTLFKEYEVNECPFTTCSVQYVIFPPFSSSHLDGGYASVTRDSIRSDNDHSEMESTEADTDTLLVTELWIEPQFGFLRASADDAQRSPTRLDLFEQLYQTDLDVIRCLVTFEHIKISCTSRCNGERSRRLCWSFSDRMKCSRSGSMDTDDFTSSASPRATSSVEADQSVVVVPSCFHISTLLSHSQLVTLLFSSLRRSGQHTDANVAFFESLNHELKQCYDVYWSIDTYGELHDLWTLISERLSTPFKHQTKLKCDGFQWLFNTKRRLKTGATGNLLPHRLPKFFAYARLLTDCRLTLVLCPASFEDVQLMWSVSEDDESGGGQPTSDLDGSYGFPLLVFNCCHKLLSSVLSGEFDTTTKLSIFADVVVEDFRSGRNNDSVLSAFHRGIRRLSGTDEDSLVRLAYEKAHSCYETVNVGAYCSFLENIYSKSFVEGVYRALLSNTPVHVADVLSVVDSKCEESAVGVELTQFLRSACKHWQSEDCVINRLEKGSTAHRSATGLDRSTFTLTYSIDDFPPDAFLSPPCSGSFYDNVQAAFRDVLRRLFKTIPGCADYYFYSPPVELVEPISDGDSFSRASQEDDDQQAVTFCLEDTPSRSKRASHQMRESGGTASTVTHRTRTTSSFSTADNAQNSSSSCASLSELVNETWRAPLFLHLTCSVQLGNELCSCSVHELPICLVTLFRECGFDSWDDDDFWKNLDIRLDLMGLTPQRIDDDEIVAIGGADWWSDNEAVDDERRGSQSVEQNDAGILQILDTVKDEITLLLESEIVFSYGRQSDGEVGESELRNVMAHIDKLAKKSNGSTPSNSAAIAKSLIYHLPLSFVLKEEESLVELKSQLRDLQLVGFHRLATCDQQSSLYYSVMRQRKAATCGRYLRTDADWSQRSDTGRSHSFAGFATTLYAKRQSLLDSLEAQSKASDQLWLDDDESLVDTGGVRRATADADLGKRRRRWSDTKTTGDVRTARNSGDSFLSGKGYEAGSSEAAAQEDHESAISESWKDRAFRDYWLIVSVTPSFLSAYLLERVAAAHSELWNNLIVELKNIIKRVNQMMLLQNLFETRQCDNLLVQEREERLWKRQSVVSNEGSESDYDIPSSAGYLAASSKFPPGYFCCPCIIHEWFAVHPRLKAGGRGSSSSRAIQAMHSLLNKFAVSNRDNMFIYKESSGAVFYLRLHERGHSAAVALNSMDDSKLEALRNSEFSNEDSFAKRLDASVASSAVGSKKFSLSRWTARQCQDKLLLTVHGVQPSNGEILGQLVPALQHRLDDAVLDVLLVTLERNPSCKLTKDDIEFLQPPVADATYLRYYILPSVALSHLFAFSYYLHQHLSDFCFKPNYAGVDARFRPYIDVKSVANFDSGVFLYHPRVAGAKGAAILCYAYVDNNGCGIPILSINPLEPHEGFTLFFRSGFSFESLISIGRYETAGRKKAAPPTLLQFAIWERGELAIAQLTTQLERATRRAVCDLVTEYGLLTAPVLDGAVFDSTISEPGSPTTLKGAFETTAQTALRKRHSSAAMHLISQKPMLPVSSGMPMPCSALVAGAPVTSMFSFENLQALVRKATDAQPPQAAQLAPQGTNDSLTRRRHNSQQMAGVVKVASANLPDANILLNPAYAEVARRWFDFAYGECGSSCVQRRSFALEAEFSRLLVLREVVEAMKKLLEPDMEILCFAESARSVGVVYENYKPSRAPVMVTDEVESTSLDETTACGVSITPGNDSRNAFIVVGFSSALWRDTMRLGRSSTCEQIPVAISSAVKPTHRILQRFLPLLPSGSGGFVPRQRLLEIVFRGREVTLYVYNCLTETSSRLEGLLLRSVWWHNARSRLLNQICLQRLGLFQIPMYNEAEAKDNPFYLFAWPEADSFVPGLCNVSQSQLMKAKCLTQFTSPYKPERWEWWQYLKSHCFNDSHSGFDPVAMQGMQFIQFRSSFLRQKDDVEILRSVFRHLSRLKTDVEACLDEELLRIVIARSRLVHSVYTPLLFSPAWREKLAAVRRPTAAGNGATSPPSPGASARSRHDSGTTATISTGATMSPVLTHRTNATLFTTGVESWHAEVQRMMLQHYVRYLCEQLGLRILSKKSRGQSDVKLQSGNHSHDIEAWTYCASSTVITFVRCFYSEPYFAVHVYVFDASLLVPDSDTDDDESADDSADIWTNLVTQSHVHSFSYDFHMRLVASYASEERRNVFKPGYNMNAFLADFLQYYTCRPPFARTYVFEDRLFAHGMTVSTDQLYDYILNHDKLFGFRVARMRIPSASKADESASEYLLTSYASFSAPTSSTGGAGGTVPFQVLHLVMRDNENVDSWKEWLSLKFYVIFVDQTNVFPQCTIVTENVDQGKYHRVRTPSWAVGAESSIGEDSSRTTGRRTLRSVESAPCRVESSDRHSSSSALRVSRRSISRDSRELAFDRTVSFSTAAIAPASEATSSVSACSSFSPVAVKDVGYCPMGVSAMAHNRATFSSTDEHIACVDVVDLSEEFLLSTGEVKTHTRSRSSADDYVSAASERGTPIRRRLPSIKPIEGSSLHTEQVTYLTYLTDDEFNMQKCLAQEAGKFKERLTDVVKEAASQCKRDLLWKKLLDGVATDGGAIKRKDDHVGIQLREFEILLKSVHSVPLHVIDPTLEPLLCVSASWFPTLVRSLQQKYGGHCRHFVTTQNAGKQYLAILNSNYLDSFMLVSTDRNSTNASIRLVYKDYLAVTAEPTSSVMGPAAENRLYRSKLIQDFCENFVQTLVFHHWTKLLP